MPIIVWLCVLERHTVPHWHELRLAVRQQLALAESLRNGLPVAERVRDDIAHGHHLWLRNRLALEDGLGLALAFALLNGVCLAVGECNDVRYGIEHLLAVPERHALADLFGDELSVAQRFVDGVALGCRLWLRHGLSFEVGIRLAVALAVPVVVWLSVLERHAVPHWHELRLAVRQQHALAESQRDELLVAERVGNEIPLGHHVWLRNRLALEDGLGLALALAVPFDFRLCVLQRHAQPLEERHSLAERQRHAVRVPHAQPQRKQLPLGLCVAQHHALPVAEPISHYK